MKAKSLFRIFFVLAFLALILPHLPFPVSALSEPPNAELSFVLARDIYLKGIDASLALSGKAVDGSSRLSESLAVGLYRTDGTLVFSDSVSVLIDGSFSYSRIFGALVAGIYEVRISCVVGIASSQWFTYVNTSDWTSVSFPLSTTWKGITYTLRADRTLRCEKDGDWIEFTFPAPPQVEGLTETATRNNMAFRYHLEKTGVVNLDLALVLSHKGLKFYYRGTQNIPRSFQVQVRFSEEPRRRANAIVVGDLVFDFDDLRISGLSFNYSGESLSGTLTVNAGTSFFLDPAIFSDGFESGDTTAWSSETENSGDVIGGSSAWAMEGTYSALCDMAGDGSEAAYVTKNSLNTATVYARMYFKMTTALPANNQAFRLIDLQNGASLIAAAAVRVTSGAEQLTMYWDNNGALQTSSVTYDWTLGTVYEIELYAYIHGTAGAYTLYLNGVSQIAQTGVDSNNDGNVTVVDVGVTYSATTSAHEVYIDSAVIDDEYIGTILPEVDASPAVSNLDSGNLIIAQRINYIITANVSDADGYDQLSYVDIEVVKDADSATFRYNQDTDAFAESNDPSDHWDLVTASSKNYSVGNNLDLEFNVRARWTATEGNSYTINIFVADSDTRSSVLNGTYPSSFNLVTNLIASISIDDDRGDVSQSITASGNVRYASSPLSSTQGSYYPPDAEFTSVSVYDSANNNEGTDNTIVNGAWSIAFNAPASVGTDTYNLYVDMADADYTDAEETPSDTFITDALMVSMAISDGRNDVSGNIRVWVNVTYAYDKASFTNAGGNSLSLNGSAMAYSAGNAWYLDVSQATVGQYVYVISALADNTYGLTGVGLINFDGSDDVIKITNSASLDFTTEVSAFVWVKSTEAGEYNCIIAQWASDVYQGSWMMYILDNNQISFGTTCGGDWDIQVMAGWTANTWHLVGGKYDGTNLWVFLDGTWSAAASHSTGGAVEATDDFLVLGKRETDLAPLFLTGTLGEVMVFNRAVSAAEGVAIYQRLISNTTGLVLHLTPASWDYTNTQWDDLSGNSNNGAVTSSTVVAGAMTDEIAKPIWDRLQVQSYTVVDSRVNIDDNVNIDALVWFDYDNTVCTTGTITINGDAAAHQGAGVYRITKTSASVTSSAYNTVACSVESTYGITAVDQNSQSSIVVWDRVRILTLALVDSRINADGSTTGTLYATADLEYDAHALGSGDSLTISGIALTWDAGDSRFEGATASSSSVTSTTYNAYSSGSEATYSITIGNINGKTAALIFDKVQVQSYTVADTRVNINDNVNINVLLYYDYDNTAVTDGTVTVNGNAASHQGLGTWRYIATSATVQSITYNTVASSGNAYGISTMDQNGQSSTVVWDRIVAYWEQTSATSVAVSTNVEWRIKAVLDYDESALGSGDTVVCSWGTMTWDATNSWFEIAHTEASAGSVTITLSSGTEATYSITAFSENITETTVTFYSYPTVGEFAAPTIAYANQGFFLNVTIQDLDGSTTFVNATINFDGGIILLWDRASDVFSESADPSSYCTITASSCVKTVVNATSFKLSFYIKLNSYSAGTVDVLAADTLVYDVDGNSGSGSYDNLFTFSYISITLQARDAAGTNLPRAVIFKGSYGNSTAFNLTSSAAGLYVITNSCYGTLTVNTWWSTYLVNSTTSSITADATINIDSYIRRLDNGAYYSLFALNNTALPAPEQITFTTVNDWQIQSVSGAGATIPFKFDAANWADTNQPYDLRYSTSVITAGWAWDSINKIFTYSIPFPADSVSLYLRYAQPEGVSGGGSGGGGGGSGSVPEPEISPTPTPYVIPPIIPGLQPIVSGTVIIDFLKENYPIVGIILFLVVPITYPLLVSQREKSKVHNLKYKSAYREDKNKDEEVKLKKKKKLKEYL